ncbi:MULTISPECIES: helix-turn-helix domain-containing protein [unclassified Ensifer]|uniref:AraC family transcriptional regulator n=1 Tax=unclassified Ensifer TaxID=2633371 RepID=UPI000812E7F1|nr:MULTISPECIES: helix-turn-helix domain-containing protein [unclassified Ensifer]OCO99045.1 transcriptional regulator [Ensifer sp. LC14]OCP11335.1 transcriptional regulator [Ensifer sp. LC13]OCP12024.1 transcriptional regulator [Ensifer sp. LC11]OCP33533.1 transcriptional regulator [Ensifer sp. LC499]
MDGSGGPLTLAKQRGIYHERAAPPALSRHIECLWSHQMPEGPTARIAVVPDGCVDILWSDHSLVVVGPDRTAAFPVIAPGTTVSGLRFRPGVAASFLRTRLSEITGNVVPLDAFWGKAARELDAKLHEATGTTRRAEILAETVLHRLAAVSPPPTDVAACLAHLGQHRPSADNPIRSLAATTGTSERTLRRRCHEHFGYGAKTLDRILRLQRFLAACRTEASENLGFLALDAGYADQAHLSREAKELTSLSPAEIRRQLGKDRLAA